MQNKLYLDQRSNAFIILNLLMLWGWWMLYQLYALPVHYAKPYFALDKIPLYLEWSHLWFTTWLFVLLCICYLCTCLLLPHLQVAQVSVRWTLILSILGAGILNVMIYPVGAVDLFYYLTQIKLFAYYGENPYLTTFWPTYAHDELTPLSSFLSWPLVYGPAWLGLASLPIKFVGFDDLLTMLLAYKLFSLYCLLGCAWLIFKLLGGGAPGWYGAYVFAANPLVLFEAVANAHNDILLTLILLVALLGLRHRHILALPAFALAALVKVFILPLALGFAVALWRTRWPFRRIVGGSLCSLLIVFLLVAPFWGDGSIIERMQAAVEQQQTLRTAAPISLANEYAQTSGASAQQLEQLRIVFTASYGCLVLLALFFVRPLEHAMASIMLLLFLLVSSLFPWYLIPVFALLALHPRRLELGYMVVASLTGLLYYPLGVVAWQTEGLTLFQIQLVGATLLALPIVVFLVALLFQRRVELDQ
ncbi:MAG: DUF2029 domain-containing protein [Candidatus Viridilinea halotolerans]|uniref:DUF2029 domain-containing protein n=1 Tax=Candidatus Viridilinea halotolerans TaxID=2491704 RepID=A0A426U131_9CHLR|nr:MAG: DUF2029 domain-containing protein [Candidatus Viridilinea halotolerans]